MNTHDYVKLQAVANSVVATVLEEASDDALLALARRIPSDYEVAVKVFGKAVVAGALITRWQRADPEVWVDTQAATGE